MFRVGIRPTELSRKLTHMSNGSVKNPAIMELYFQFSPVQFALNEILEKRLQQKRDNESDAG